MNAFTPGDRVHFAGLGSGVVREARSGNRYLVEIKGRAVVAAGGQLELAAGSTGAKPSRPEPAQPPDIARAKTTARSIDLHGKTVEEALAAVEVFINDALLEGSDEVRVIHGRSGGRIKSAVHRYLRQLPAIASARVDPHNEGVTIVTFA